MDPIGYAGGSYNLYEWVGSNPINRVDPSGLEPRQQTDSWRGMRNGKSGTFFQIEYYDRNNLFKGRDRINVQFGPQTFVPDSGGDSNDAIARELGIGNTGGSDELRRNFSGPVSQASAVVIGIGNGVQEGAALAAAIVIPGPGEIIIVGASAKLAANPVVRKLAADGVERVRLIAGEWRMSNSAGQDVGRAADDLEDVLRAEAAKPPAPVIGTVRRYDEAKKARIAGYDDHHLDPPLGRNAPDYGKDWTVPLRNDNSRGKLLAGVNVHTGRDGFQKALDEHIAELGYTREQWRALSEDIRLTHLRRYYASLGIPFP